VLGPRDDWAIEASGQGSGPAPVGQSGMTFGRARPGAAGGQAFGSRREAIVQSSPAETTSPSPRSLRDHPEFYNALTSNCVTDIVPHARAGHPAAHIGWQILLSGYAARQAYQNGNLDQSMPFEQLEAHSRINEAAVAADKDSDFSTRIRMALPAPAR